VWFAWFRHCHLWSLQHAVAALAAGLQFGRSPEAFCNFLLSEMNRWKGVLAKKP